MAEEKFLQGWGWEGKEEGQLGWERQFKGGIPDLSPGGEGEAGGIGLGLHEGSGRKCLL